MSDWQLLRQYLDDHSQAAFAKLVDQHMKLVYWTCWRDVQDSQLAEDITQEVFILLACKAKAFRKEISISGWLFHTARLMSQNARKKERRRRLREEKAAQNLASSCCEWPQIEPYLNDALSALTASDREAILMRYLEGMSMREVATKIGTSEGTASKRILRAVDKMRRFLQQKEVAVTSVALAARLAQHESPAAPPSCQAAILRAVQNLPAGHSTPHSTLFQKGIAVALETAKWKAVTIYVLLIGGIIVPLAVRKAHRSSYGTFTFIDKTHVTNAEE